MRTNGMNLLRSLVPMLAQRSNTRVFVHDCLSGRLNNLNLHVEFWEIPNPTGGCAAQLSEFEFELWAAGDLVVEFQGGE